MASPKRSDRVYVSTDRHDMKDEGENTQNNPSRVTERRTSKREKRDTEGVEDKNGGRREEAGLKDAGAQTSGEASQRRRRSPRNPSPKR
ncbi:hypothetical protein EYF80_055654 [Liparis tanakae]|uniref:Uncharacterized protein n=1 Tax=Liparis tanakae TaxID=230148 RepID=A0A4Z2EZ96_9TELE|nr:hypothetical protein EYF80_055654 [Liparis tanakae]